VTLDERLRSALHDASPSDVPAGYVNRVMTSLPERRPFRPWRLAAGVVAAALVIALAGIAWSGAWVGTVKAPLTPTATVARATTTASAAANPSAGLTATDDGLTLQVVVDGASVAPGGQITVQITLHNGRSTPVDYRGPPCTSSPASIQLTVALPLEPAGDTWGGLLGQYKRYVLTTGKGPGDVPATSPVQILLPTADPLANQCAGSGGQLPPGQTIHRMLTWTADIVPGVPALPGDVPFTVAVDHDPEAPPTPRAEPTSSGFHQLPGLQPGPQYRTLTVSGDLRVVGAPSAHVTVGQALDSMLRDGRFTAWLAEQPMSSWVNANLFLEYVKQQGGSIIPPGSSWEVDMFREPRNWAIGFVDPISGTLRSLTFCNIPCSR